MAVIKSGASTDQLTVGATSKAIYMEPRDPAGRTVADEYCQTFAAAGTFTPTGFTLTGTDEKQKDASANAFIQTLADQCGPYVLSIDRPEPKARAGKLRIIASSTGYDGAVKIHADAIIYAGLFNGSQSATLKLDPKRKAYAHLIRGMLTINGQKLVGGDALFIEDEPSLVISDGVDAEVLIFDLSH